MNEIRMLEQEREPVQQTELEQEEQSQQPKTALLAPQPEEIIEGEFIVEEAPRIRRRPSSLFLVLCLAFFSLCLGVFYPTVIAPFLKTSLPRLSLFHEERLNLTTPLTLPSRSLSVTRSMRFTTQATGHDHQAAENSTGFITFYNAASYSQTIDAGTLLVGQDGVQVVTDQSVSIPAALPPTEGQAIVFSHVIFVGAAGNIDAGDIQGICCKAYVFAYNSAFSGGRNERDYTTVTKVDITNATHAIIPQLTTLVTSSFTSQLQKDEQETPPICVQRVATDHAVGSEAENVTVTATQTCTSFAYNNRLLEQQARTVFTDQSRQLYGVGSSISGVGEHVITITPGKQTLVFLIQITGTVTYSTPHSKNIYLWRLMQGRK